MLGVAKSSSSDSVPAAAAGEPVDPLLLSLAWAAKHFGQPFSSAGVLGGLPLSESGRLDLAMLGRAAERCGLKATLVEQKPSLVPAIVLPCVVALKGGEACILIERAARGRKAVVVIPSASDQKKTVKIADLERDATGTIIYLSRLDLDESAEAPAAPIEPERSARHWFWSHVLALWPAWVQVVVAAMVVNVLGLVAPLFVMNVYDRVVPNQAISTLWALAAGVCIAVVFEFVLRQLRAVVLDRSGQLVDVKVASALFERTMAIAMPERKQPIGMVANQVREFETVRDFFTSSTIIAVSDFMFTGIILVVMWMIVGPIAVVALAAILIVAVATMLFQLPLKRAIGATLVHASRRHGVLVEALSGVQTIKALGAEGIVQRSWDEAVAATARANASTRVWSAAALHFSMLVQQIATVIMIIWGVFLISEGQVSMGGLIAASMLAGRALAPLSSIALTIARWQQARAAMRGISALMRQRVDRDGPVVSSQVITSGAVAFSDVTFTYPDAPSPALTQLTLRIASGERVGIVGRVGSGKSTLGRLLMRFHEPDSGRVTVDGADVRAFDPHELRRAAGFVSQDTELFSGTLRDNLVMGRPTATEHEIAVAAQVAGVDRIAASHPSGYGMPVGERGLALSGGQRQAVAIARALLRRPKILFLDEPSSAMDINSEAELIRGLKDWMVDGQTLIVCTHRMALVELCTRLVVIDGGRVVADGPRDQVLAQLSGKPKVALTTVNGERAAP